MRLNVFLAVYGAALLTVFAVLYFVVAGGSGGEAENRLTLEEQTPRVEQKPAEASAPTVEETPEPERQEEESAPETVEEETAPSDNGETARPAEPEAPQAVQRDPFTMELQEAVDELTDFVDSVESKFSNNPMSDFIVSTLEKLSDEIMRYDAELSRQNLPREERIAKLKARAEKITDDAGEPEMDESDPSALAAMGELMNYMEANMPRKFMTLLGLDW